MVIMVPSAIKRYEFMTYSAGHFSFVCSVLCLRPQFSAVTVVTDLPL